LVVLVHLEFSVFEGMSVEASSGVPVRHVILIVVLLLLCASSPARSQQEFGAIEGKWVTIAGPEIGEPIWFRRAFGGYDALISWWGQTKLSLSDGRKASHIKVTNRNNLECYYHVSLISPSEMIWSLREGAFGCPESAVFRREGLSYEAEANKAIARGATAMNQGDYDRAIAEFNEAIRLKPSDSTGFNYRGNAYFAKSDFERAVLDYGEAIRLNPLEPGLFYNRSNAYKNKNDYGRVISDCSEAIRLKPDNYLFFNCRGNAYLVTKDFERAVTDFKEAFRLNPNEPIVSQSLKNAIFETRVFELFLCNRTSKSSYFAVSGRRRLDSSDWTIEGWFPVLPAQCVSVGKFAKSSNVYWIVDQDGETRRGNGFKFCITKKPIRTIFNPAHECSGDEKLESFVQFSPNNNPVQHVDFVP
jgi:tetratricopeptide (TPR) repeat protein